MSGGTAHSCFGVGGTIVPVTTGRLPGRWRDVSASQVAVEPLANALCHGDRLRSFEQDLGVADARDELVGGAHQLGQSATAAGGVSTSSSVAKTSVGAVTAWRSTSIVQRVACHTASGDSGSSSWWYMRAR